MPHIMCCCCSKCVCVCRLEQLGFNALLQLMIGVPLEMVHGILRISLLYMAGVVAGKCARVCVCFSYRSCCPCSVTSSPGECAYIYDGHVTRGQ